MTHEEAIAKHRYPLTLEQMRKMDGRPVWVKLIGKNKGRKEGWTIIYNDDGYAAVQRWTQFPLWYKDYGKTWLAYDYSPTYIDRKSWEPCEWCGEWIGGECNPRERDAGYKLYAGYCKQVAADDFIEDETDELSYCPKCGRPLTDEAWDELGKRMEV